VLLVRACESRQLGDEQPCRWSRGLCGRQWWPPPKNSEKNGENSENSGQPHDARRENTDCSPAQQLNIN
jgi:hypothetical protein